MVSYKRYPSLHRYPTPCFHCDVARATQWDHLIPQAVGGPDQEWNIVPSCGPCNNRRPRAGEDLRDLGEKLPEIRKERIRRWYREKGRRWKESWGVF